MIGLAAVAFKKRVKRKNSFYCAEFVKYALEETNISMDLPDIIRPQNFGEIKNIRVCYRGRLRDYGLERRKKLLMLRKQTSVGICGL